LFGALVLEVWLIELRLRNVEKRGRRRHCIFVKDLVQLLTFQKLNEFNVWDKDHMPICYWFSSF